MPEHDTFDLDAAFDALERDIAGLSRGPGAARAVSTARRRRRTRIGAVAAVAVLLVGGVVVGNELGHDRAVEPAGRPLPTPAPLSVQGLDNATHGWSGSWHTYTDADKKYISNQGSGECGFLVKDQFVAQPTRNGAGIFLTTGGAQTVVWRIGIRGTQAATQEYHATVAAFEACRGHHDQTFTYPDGAEATVAALPGTGQKGNVVVATRYHDRAGTFALGPAPAPTPEQAARLADLVMAATVDDRTYDVAGPAAIQLGESGLRPHPAPLVGTVSAQALGPALDGWSTPWDPQFSKTVPDGSLAACVGNPEGHDPGNGLILNVGRNGIEWVHGFASEAAATQAAAGIRDGLATCATPYVVRTSTLPSGRSVVVATGRHTVLWVTRVGSHVVVLQLPAGSTPLPDAVSVKVGQVLEKVLERLENTGSQLGATAAP